MMARFCLTAQHVFRHGPFLSPLPSKLRPLSSNSFSPPFPIHPSPSRPCSFTRQTQHCLIPVEMRALTEWSDSRIAQQFYKIQSKQAWVYKQTGVRG